MLVLTRKKEESIRIGGDITIKIIDIDNRQVKLGIQAPKDISVNREEIYLRILAENKAAHDKNQSELNATAHLQHLAGFLKKDINKK